MTRTALRRIALTAILAPLALGLAACKKDDTAGATLSGAPLAAVAAPAGKTWAETFTVTSEGGYLMGNPQAPIKLIEFGALSCSHCADFSEKSSAELRDKFIASGRVSYELRLMLNNALDVPADLLATCGPAEAVIPLSEQFWAWQRTMFDNLRAAGDAKSEAINQLPREQQAAAMAQLTGMDQFFAARGISSDQAKACLADTAKAEKLVKNANDYSSRYQITGTPTFIVNGSKMDYNTWDLLKADLEKLGAR